MKKLSLVSMILFAALLAGCSGENNAAESADDRVLVKVATAGEQEVEQIAEFTGTIQPYKENVISPSMQMRIDDILVEVGDRVTRGQLLVKMDRTQYDQAAVQLATLETDLQRMQNVYDANGISKQQLDAQRTQMEVTKAQARNLLDNVDLRSPINGIVTARNYDPGDMYMLGSAGILTVMQMDRLKVQINVSEQYFTQVKLGMPVDIRIDLFGDQTFPAKVTLIYPAIDPGTRTFTVEITIPNANLKLRPGMYSRVTLNFGKAERVMIPDIALQKQVGSNERYVYTVSDSVAHRQSVVVGRQIGEQYEVLSGVEPGQEVVTAGASKLMEGARVKITQ